jgi:predicted  nucleic acid-binding Zn-ribbon protein
VNGPALLALQLVDNELDHLAALERRLPERAALDVAEAEHRAWAARCATQRARVDEALAQIAKAEHESAAIGTKRSRLEAQLKTVIAPREAEALMHEIAKLQADRDALDDIELAAMDQQGDAEAALADLAQREPVLLEGIAAARAALDAALGDVAGQRQGFHDRRAAATADLDAADLALYAELRTRHGGMGIVRLEGRRCIGCHLDLSASEVDVLKAWPAGELPECPHCGRSIVL